MYNGKFKMDVVMLRIVNALIRLACAATLTVRRDYPADEPHTEREQKTSVCVLRSDSNYIKCECKTTLKRHVLLKL